MARQAKSWVVDFDSDAVIDFEDVKSRADRKAVFNVVQKLKDVGPDLPSPHMKSLKGRADLFELRPRRWACEARPIYARLGQRFLVLAVAAKKKDFDRAVAAAAARPGARVRRNPFALPRRAQAEPARPGEEARRLPAARREARVRRAQPRGRHDHQCRPATRDRVRARCRPHEPQAVARDCPGAEARSGRPRRDFGRGCRVILSTYGSEARPPLAITHGD